MSEIDAMKFNRASMHLNITINFHLMCPLQVKRKADRDRLQSSERVKRERKNERGEMRNNREVEDGSRLRAGSLAEWSTALCFFPLNHQPSIRSTVCLLLLSIIYVYILFPHCSRKLKGKKNMIKTNVLIYFI